MRGATHGYWCNAITWPTKCPGCKAPIFFFSCKCGSRVFFDELGVPWPIHDCDTSWARSLKRTTDKTGKISVELAEGITVIRNPVAAIGKVARVVDWERAPQKSRPPDPFVAVEPQAESTRRVVGILREITRSACPFKKYRLDDTSMMRAMIAPLGKQKMGRITVHMPLHDKVQSESFTLWIPSVLIEDHRIICGLTVSVGLESVEILRVGHVWFSDEFEIIG